MKKLIFCFDGTCNDPTDFDDFVADTSITNILKLHLLLGGTLVNESNVNTAPQSSYYYSGVGTYGSWLSRAFNSVFAPEFADINTILQQAKQDLARYQNQEVEVFIFGFSRGAALARRFAASIDVNVAFLGVFDTVAAIGLPDLSSNSRPASDVVFENGTLASNVMQAVHLVALDEKRLAFKPTLFNQDPRVLEVWFPGVHSDIGGGFWFDGLSDVSLAFMLQQAIKAGLVFYQPTDVNFTQLHDMHGLAICLDDIDIVPLIDGVLHQQQRGHHLATKTLAIRQLCVHEADNPSNQHTAIIHHSVMDRLNQVIEYRPVSLRNSRFRILEVSGTLSEEKIGIAALRAQQ
ncbi:T6SS phospholipase effector Tle1-like catalytic domain-containing protein [Pseudoalteromonas tunicata]|jgi:pimeloyl-ACP methyl ester carboxylesterase|uniref:T6SS Phospholipase effector Tle1-like catalytic domain-containing protein n=1 Tax=Pseudoalteromonas tunicata D2 TaxID=87626 RepID=A4CFH3_9GAMM|nr:DUF2235 domain-containing protein [Pseudoalteromonas tunicata]ATC95183.1 hypothetical protein PTUN_a2749 [Pseudoalteromonas tunicata]AXT30796.1 DUF2235 domain-containing protein [Pseudoalteromonas tunicata]EAR26511.1 hypothetical protein PTD2_22557 [Pseudoalteromonas tunicata D2]